MRQLKLDNVNILSQEVLPAPAQVRRLLRPSSIAKDSVRRSRERIQAILDGTDRRLLAIVGPCSIHRIDSALKYAVKLAKLAKEVDDTFLVIMRVYFEKPRTSVGWKGFINDPYLDDSFRIDKGLQLAREFLLKLAEMGLPTGTEALDPITPQYIGDLISWTSIGARTAESQPHRDMASGLSTPVGFKNGTDGNMDIAINALKAVARPQHFLGMTGGGRSAVFGTRGNHYCHIVLRGGTQPNYRAPSIGCCEKKLLQAGLPLNILVDCSHGNSRGDPARQITVLEDCVRQIIKGNKSLIGFMVESNLKAGKQTMPEDLRSLKPDVSLTDSCMDWQSTEAMLRSARSRLRVVLPGRFRG